MRVISIRKGYECDHSTRDYGYISGIHVSYDYGDFDMKFTVPYNTELFRLLQKHKHLYATKKFNKIDVTVTLYCEGFNEDEYQYADLARRIREELIRKNVEVMKILEAYNEVSKDFERIKPKTELGKELMKVLTVTW